MNIFGNDNRALIALAIKCRLIPMDQEAVLLDQLARKRQQIRDYAAADLFRDLGLLSRENLDFLLAVREHLEMKMLDRKFGELGIANQFVRPESVKKALELQNAIFKKTSQSKLIGDILLENNEITQADKSAILLTQDRIADELLAQAMNDIATTEIEKLSLNMRFGAIAVKKNHITIKELNQALKIQEEQVKSGEARPYLGQILKEHFGLSDPDLNHILKIQKELEKKRLALEAALEKYNSETSVNQRLSSTFHYRFSRNKLAAFLGQTRKTYEQIRLSDLKRWLGAMGITWGLCPDETLQAFLDENRPGNEIQVAEGRSPEPGEDGRLEFYFDTRFDAQGMEEDPELLPFVKKGDALASRIPVVPGRPGRDVSGFYLATPEPRQAALNCGEGVIRDKDLFIADIDGIARLYKNRTLFVKERQIDIPTRHFTGTIGGDLGEEYKDVNLKVEGDILASGKVRCQTLTVSGRILGQVYASGDIIAKGEIGELPQGESQLPEPAKIKAEGEILASKAISNAIVITAKSLTAPNSDLRAAGVQAFQDITVKNILHSDSRPCVIQTGKAPTLKADSLEILIRSKTRERSTLACTAEFEQLENWLGQKQAVKNSFLCQQEFLLFVLGVIQLGPLSHLSSLSDKITTALDNQDQWPELPPFPETLSPDCESYIKTFLETAEHLPPQELENYTREQADIKYGMYRAAVNADRRYTMEYETRRTILQEKVDQNWSAIKKLDAIINKLTVRKDTFLLSQAYTSQPVPPAVRVKNKVTKGTIIKGLKDRLTVDQDIFGVKFTEMPKTQTDPARILIEGYYD